MSGALAIQPDQSFWTDDQALVLQQAGIDQGVTRPELQSFLHLCQRTGLDPFSRQIYLIGRYDSRQGRKVYNPQTGIDGYRIVAQRTAERTREPLSYDDTLWCGPDGQWTDVWLSPEPPAAAKVTVYRGGARFSATATWAEYVPTNRDGKPTGLWSKMPAVMVAKCAEALALRKAFPHDLAGVYTQEEMAQADNRPAAHPVLEPAPAPDPAEADVVEGEVLPDTADPETGEVADDAAQTLAAEALRKRSVDTLRAVYDTARGKGLLNTPVTHPKTENRMPLSVLIQTRKAELLAAAQREQLTGEKTPEEGEAA